MTADVFRTTFHLPPVRNLIDNANSVLHWILSGLGYTTIFFAYAIIFILAFVTVGFLEIRQANMVDFNALIAVLDQRDRYNTQENYVSKAISQLRQKRVEYESQIKSFACYDFGPSKGRTRRAKETVMSYQNHGGEIPDSKPQTCADIKQALQHHANELSLIEDELRFSAANLDVYYGQYEDGIAQKTPQIIPALKLLESPFILVSSWARSPFELVEMFLLVLMGLLGGVISVIRSLIRRSETTPSIWECFYTPAVGATLSLGVYVLFRAAQIFLGVQNQNSAGNISTSIFLLAGLGLASGLCATEALGQIESVATKLLRSSGGDRIKSTSQ